MKNRERFGYMLNRYEENAGFVDYLLAGKKHVI
jgi:hypothetical protein